MPHHRSATVGLQGARALVGRSSAWESASSGPRPRDPHGPALGGRRAAVLGPGGAWRARRCIPGLAWVGSASGRCIGGRPLRGRCSSRQPPAGVPWLRRTPGQRPRLPPPCSPPPWGRVRGGELRFARTGSGSRSSKIAEGGARAAASCPRPNPLAPAACSPTSSPSLACRPLPRTGPPRWDAAPRPLRSAEPREAEPSPATRYCPSPPAPGA